MEHFYQVTFGGGRSQNPSLFKGSASYWWLDDLGKGDRSFLPLHTHDHLSDCLFSVTGGRSLHFFQPRPWGSSWACGLWAVSCPNHCRQDKLKVIHGQTLLELRLTEASLEVLKNFLLKINSLADANTPCSIASQFVFCLQLSHCTKGNDGLHVEVARR